MCQSLVAMAIYYDKRRCLCIRFIGDDDGTTKSRLCQREGTEDNKVYGTYTKAWYFVQKSLQAGDTNAITRGTMTMIRQTLFRGLWYVSD